jgi:hypothetical protein
VTPGMAGMSLTIAIGKGWRIRPRPCARVVAD